MQGRTRGAISLTQAERRLEWAILALHADVLARLTFATRSSCLRDRLRPRHAQGMEDQRISRGQLGGIHDNLEGIRCSRITGGAPRFVRENAFAECARGKCSAFLAVVSRIHVVHGFHPPRRVLISRLSTTESWMASDPERLQVAVSYRRGYSEKVG